MQADKSGNGEGSDLDPVIPCSPERRRVVQLARAVAVASGGINGQVKGQRSTVRRRPSPVQL